MKLKLDGLGDPASVFNLKAGELFRCQLNQRSAIGLQWTDPTGGRDLHAILAWEGDADGQTTNERLPVLFTVGYVTDPVALLTDEMTVRLTSEMNAGHPRSDGGHGDLIIGSDGRPLIRIVSKHGQSSHVDFVDLATGVRVGTPGPRFAAYSHWEIVRPRPLSSEPEIIVRMPGRVVYTPG